MPENKGRDHFCENPMCSMHQHKANPDREHRIRLPETSNVVGWDGYQREREVIAEHCFKWDGEDFRYIWLCEACANVLRL